MPVEAVVLEKHEGDRMVHNIEDYRSDTREDLIKQIAATEACRDFWYRAYVKASTYAIEQIEAAVEEARRHIVQDHEQCDAALRDMEKKIGAVVRKMFVTDGRRTGSDAVLPSSVPRAGDGA